VLELKPYTFNGNDGVEVSAPIARPRVPLDRPQPCVVILAVVPWFLVIVLMQRCTVLVKQVRTQLSRECRSFAHRVE
jgi:hypothetical protein